MMVGAYGDIVVLLQIVVIVRYWVQKKGIDVQGLDDLSTPNHLDIPKGSNITWAPGRHQRIKSGIDCGKFVGARIDHLAHDVDSYRAAIG